MPSDGPTHAVLARKDGLAVVGGAERAVILDLDRPSEPPVVLDGSAHAVWDALAQPHTADEVVAEVATRYGEEPETVGPAVRAFLDELVGRGLVIVR